MYVKEVEINNFRIYYGKNKINLAPQNDKNIIVVSGRNGFGKTTFLMALVWCLYGKQMGKVDELYAKEIKDKGNYTKYITSSLNRKAEQEGENEFSVSIIFSDINIPAIPYNEIEIIRKYNTYGLSDEKVEVLIDGRKNELIENLNDNFGEETFIREFILPIEVAKFFFFDAEKIVSLAEVNSNDQRQQLSKAYSEVLGIRKYEDLRTTLEDIQDGYRKKSATPEDKKNLTDLESKIKKFEIEREENFRKIDDLREEKNLKQKESDELQRKLIQIGQTITEEDLISLKKEEEKFRQEKENLQSNLKESYYMIPFALAGENLLSILEQIKNEDQLKKQNYKKQNIEVNITNIRQDIEAAKKNLDFVPDVKTSDFYKIQIENLIKKYFFAESEVSKNITPLHDFSDVQSNEFKQLVNTLRFNFKEKFKELNLKYTSAKNNLDSIARKIRDAEKFAANDIVLGFRNQKANTDKRISEIDQEIGKLEYQNDDFTNQLKVHKQEQERLRKSIDEAAKYPAKEEKTRQLISILQEFTVSFKNEKKKNLEVKMLEGLNMLLHKRNFIKKVEVDISFTGNDIDIILHGKKQKIDKASLSMGERQMYASALLNALVDESDIDFPVFIDSPMQKFDEQHAKNIIVHFYPNVSKQVVIFPLIGKELTEGEYNRLLPNISSAYLIENTSTDSSKFLESESKNLFKKYKEIYNAN